MRVYVESDMTVCHGYHVVSLKAGQEVDGPLAVYLAESGCDVTIEDDDRPQPDAAEQTPATEGTGGQDPVEIPLSATVSQDSTADSGPKTETPAEDDEPTVDEAA